MFSAAILSILLASAIPATGEAWIFNGTCRSGIPCNSALVWFNANSKGETRVLFSNGDPGKPVIGFAGVPIEGDGPLFFLDSIYLGDGKPALPLNSNGNGQSCHFYFTDHGGFTHGWENRLTTIECNAKVKLPDGRLINLDVRFDTTGGNPNAQ